MERNENLAKDLDCSKYFDPYAEARTVGELIKALEQIKPELELTNPTVVGFWKDDGTISVFEND